MHVGRSYKLAEFLFWTRRNIFWLLVLGIVSTVFYQLLDFKWVAFPFTVVALLGTATAFIIGFRNQETYRRSSEARQTWGAMMSASRSWAIMCRDFVNDGDKTRELIYRHFAWITVLRYQLRSSRGWENTTKAYNKEYRKYYSVPEMETSLEQELQKYISRSELRNISCTKNKAMQLMSLQSDALKKLQEDGLIDEFKFSDMHIALRAFFDHQGRNERIKNFPYPRQYATINSLFMKLFCLLLPFGLLQEFDRLNDGMTGFLQGKMVWLVIPFSVLISWVFTSLEQVGESTENPFEGSANDVPISQMSRSMEIDIKEMLNETDLPSQLEPINNIIL